MTLAAKGKTQKLILGTVQFGLNYGISNQYGQLQQQEIKQILHEAYRASIRTLDTAAAYGESEQNIGDALQSDSAEFCIISKFPPDRPQTSIRQALEESLERLGIARLHGYLLHSYSTYQQNPEVLNELQAVKALGLVDKIGISLYHPQEAEELLAQQAPIDIVQFPYSIFDRRFEEVLPRLRQQGMEAHVRSVYLQGLYFLAPDKLPAYFAPVKAKLTQLQQLAHDSNLPLAALLLGFALANPDITNVVIGVESLETLQQNVNYSTTNLNKTLLKQLYQFKEENEAILLPYHWPNT
ncbi:aldo/keto reductase [Pontibacter chitinilyticus]|uniref:aldo/keto reductase n=1 Tax=Pontibacter chitinilyticus TaxID=2674989 RepID=UPI003218F5E6